MAAEARTWPLAQELPYASGAALKSKHKTTKQTNKQKKKSKKIISFKGSPLKLSVDFSPETLTARREWHGIFKVLKGKNLQSRIFDPAILSFSIEEEIKYISDKQKLKT